MSDSELPVPEGGGGLLYKVMAWAVGGMISALVQNVAKLVAVGVSAVTFSTFAIGSSLVEVLELYFPTRGVPSDLSAYQVTLGYAQAWFDVVFLLQLVVAYWTFVAVLAMTRFLLSFIPGVG